MRLALLDSLLLLLSVTMALAVDRSKFKSCQQSGFCKRCRSMEPGTSSYSIDPDSIQINPTVMQTVVVNNENGVRFHLEIFALKDSILRFRMKEAHPLVPRFEVPDVLNKEPEEVPMKVIEKSENKVVLEVEQKHKVVVQSNPFTIDFYSDDELVLKANARGLLKFEHTREKEEEEAEEEDMWEESFGGHTDSKPHGPQAVAMDFTFEGVNDVYGIPEHADHFSLSDTSVGEPYRLYNLDVFEYELWNPMALYGSVPFMISHRVDRTTGLFWLNAAETWIDVKKSSVGGGVLESISNMVGGTTSSVQVTHKVETHWMSESGIIDVFVLLGPGPKNVSSQYASLTGSTPLPPLFSLAYHQCRWNYNDQEDVKMVSDKFDEHDIPMDVMWLDIEHTNDKKYFTWDQRKFPDSQAMIDRQSSLGRKMVTIVDPHIKKDTGYWVHNDCTNLGLYVKNKDGKSDYEGWCWPGASYYADFLNPATKKYFAEQYQLENYKGSTLDLFTWNDMNEPSVFNGPEVTMNKDLIHFGGWEHRDVHNIYGHQYVMASHSGHLLRSGNELRPFILTRSAFAGTQRYAAKWTGDNGASWDHLEVSLPMCLSLAVAGISFCGADVGGFFGNPDPQLFVRWYQAAAFQPFFRSHAHIDTKRREPWLFGDHTLSLIRQAILWKYTHLPYWYTLFYEGEKDGVPPMRPLFFEFPKEKEIFAIENEYMVGAALLVHPITKPDVTSEQIYLPLGGYEPGEPSVIWYDAFTGMRVPTTGYVTVDVVEDRIPLFQRGGTILPKKERTRRSSAAMVNDPYTLIVALNSDNKAIGSLYVDDGKSFDYRKGEFFYIQFNFDGKILSGHLMSAHPTQFKSTSWLERVVILGFPKAPSTVKVLSPGSVEEDISRTYYNPDKQILTIPNPGVNIASDWNIIIDG